MLSARQDKLRDEPLASLQLPILFVRGTRDQFCDDGPWEEVRPRLTSPDITVHTVEGGDHGLKVKGGKVRLRLHSFCWGGSSRMPRRACHVLPQKFVVLHDMVSTIASGPMRLMQ